jgi:hypothetical protein
MKTKLKEKLPGKLLLNGVIAGAIISALSFFVSIVPCSKESGAGLCTLPNPLMDMTDLAKVYYGISNNPITGLLLQFTIPFILFVVIPLIIKKTEKKQKILDLTKN